MSSTLTEHLSRGIFSFLRPDQDVRRIFPAAEALLPEPQQIFLEDEKASPLIGFPILASRQLRALDEALEDCLTIEEETQFAFHNRDSFDSTVYASRWDRYRTLLAQATENVILSSHGQNYAGVFWLYHSLRASQRIKMIPKRLLRMDLKIGRERGDEVKYKVFFKFIDRVVTLTQDIVNELASTTDEDEDVLFPTLLSLMRDNVLIFTEDHISPDLAELQSYFGGCLHIDGRSLRQRLRALEEWHRGAIENDPLLRGAVSHLLDSDPSVAAAGRLVTRSGYVRFLAGHPGYRPDLFLDPEQVQVWESLLLKLKEFEVLHALRKMVVPLEEEEGVLRCRDRSINTTWVGGPPVLNVSPATRPLDFLSSWVVDPRVHRFGLVYDLTQFSETLSTLGRAETSSLDQAFRLMFRFQRRINRLASARNLKLEKYLGDGAFYSGRQPRRLISAAVHLQRAYLQFLELGLAFDRGLRIALNFSQYRLLPLESGESGEVPRYEFFGHGIVELSRLVTGKATQQIDEFKNYLVSRGYPEHTVNKFFAPMLSRDEDLVSKLDEERRFYAYINQNGSLINEGIVATQAFVSGLGEFDALYYVRDRGRGFIVLPIDDEPSGQLLVGLRKLGIPKFKGLDQHPVYEVVDGCWNTDQLKQIPQMDLPQALDRLFTSAMAARRKPKPNQGRAESPI